MSVYKVLITDAEYPDLSDEQRLLEEAGCQVSIAQCRLPEEVILAARDAFALMVQYAPITSDVIHALPNLKLISRAGVGVDSVDLDAAKEKGVWVANVPDYGVHEVASHAAAMILSLLRHVCFLDRKVREGVWHYLSTGEIHRISSLTLGVVGLGRIGRTLASMMVHVFGRVIGYDPYLPANAWPEGVDRVDLRDLFMKSNVVSLHLPLTKETSNMVNREFLALMPVGSYLVNTARGGLVNMEDLIYFLDNGHLAGAALDVLPKEPPVAGDPIIHHPNIIITPHVAWYSEESEKELRYKWAMNVVAFLKNGRPLYPVVMPVERSS